MSQNQFTTLQEQTRAQDLEAMNSGDSDGLPDYATIDPNDGERPVTPFPRPMSPTPSQFSSMASDGGRTGWPLANAHEVERPDSAHSYTSSRPYKTTRAKFQAHKAKRGNTMPANRAPFFTLRRAAQRSTSNDMDGPPRGIPEARLASGRGRLLMQRSNSVGSFSTFTNHTAAAKKTESKQGSGLLPQMSRITSVWGTVGSFFSSSSSVPVARELSVGEPFELRHIAGVGPDGTVFAMHANEAVPTAAAASADAAGENEEFQTQSVLMDVRSESRLGNRTSLPVNMPNAISPIDNAVLDAGTGHNTPVRGAVNRFESPASPAVTARHIRRSSSTPAQSGKIFPGETVTFYNMANVRVLFWGFVALTETSMISVAASLTVVIVQDARYGQARDGARAWLVSSLFCFLLSGLTLVVMYAHRLSDRMVRQHRYQQRDQELIEHVGTANRIGSGVRPLQDELAHRQVLVAADQETQDRAWDKFASDPQRVRSYVERLEEEVRHMAVTRAGSHVERVEDDVQPTSAARTDADAQKRVRGIFEVFNIQRADPHPDMIGIARSDSLIHGHDGTASPTILFQPCQPGTAMTSPFSPVFKKTQNEDSDPVLSEEEISTISRSVPVVITRIPHSAAVADLSSEANINMSNSTTKSTISSFLSSYASDSEAAATRPSSASLGRANEALHSHPVHHLPRPIVTEAGTPNSDKSGDRYRVPGLSGPGSSAGGETDWSVRDGVVSRLATMTPIEERSESASAYGSR